MINTLAYARRNKFKKYALIAIAITVVVIAALIVLFPFIWLVPNALKDKTEIWTLPPRWIPKHLAWSNFASLLEEDVNGGYFFRSFFVTMLEATVATILNLSINMLAAFGFAKHEFRFKKLIWVLFIFTMFVPGITVQITSIQVVTKLHLTNTLWVLILPTAANAYSIFFFRQFFLKVPTSLEESAELDGASRFQIYTRIILPLSKTPIIIAAFGCFVGHWNSYIWPTLTITENQEKYRQIMQFVYNLNNSNPTQYGKVVAATLVAMSVPIIIFSIFQKDIVEGINLSGGK